MIFDEVDAGIGGAKVGGKVGLLPGGDQRKDSQVLVITHLASIAALADTHHGSGKSPLMRLRAPKPRVRTLERQRARPTVKSPACWAETDEASETSAGACASDVGQER